MAIFHFTVTQTKRSKGQSAIASAAYRSGERLYSEYYGEYRKKFSYASDLEWDVIMKVIRRLYVLCEKGISL